MTQPKLQTAGVAYPQRIRKVKDLERTTIALSRLEAHLWESANISRGPVDAADFKTYIFPLLFFKRICDVWDEEYDEPVKDFGDPQLAQLSQLRHVETGNPLFFNGSSQKVCTTFARLFLQ
jgi:type I restriction enzyme M protein